MPLYEYQSPSGATVTEHRTVEQRDDPVEIAGETYARVRVPSRLMVGVGAKPETMGSKLAKGYYKLEERGQMADRPGYLPAKKIKEALAAPEVD